MKNSELTLQQRRVEALYDRELRIIIYKITRQEALEFLPISHCKCDKKFQSIRIYVAIEENPKNEKLIDSFNKRYSSLIKKELVSTKKFRRIPQLIFLFDRELNEINKFEKRICDWEFFAGCWASNWVAGYS